MVGKEEMLKEKMYKMIPSTQAEVLLELSEAVKSKARWCARQNHKQIRMVKAGFVYAQLCNECADELMLQHEGVMVVG